MVIDRQQDLDLTALTRRIRRHVVQMVFDLKHGLVEIIKSKFSYIFEPPWLFAGLDGHRVGKLREAKTVGQRIIEWFETRIRDGRDRRDGHRHRDGDRVECPRRVHSGRSTHRPPSRSRCRRRPGRCGGLRGDALNTVQQFG